MLHKICSENMQMASLLGPQDGLRRCSVCARSKYEADRNQTFSNADCLWAHIATTHIFWYPFECVLCPMMFLPTEGVLKQHYERTHPEKVPKAIYTYVEEKKAEIGRIFDESQRFLESKNVRNSNANPNAGNQQDEFAEELLKILHQQPQNINIADTEDNEVTAIETEKGETLDMNKPTNDGKRSEIIIQLETAGNTSVVALEGDQGVIWDQPQSNNCLGEAEGADIASSSYNRQSAKQSPIGGKGTVSCKLCKDKTTAMPGPVKGKGHHVFAHHMGSHQRFSCKSCGYKTSLARCMIEHSRNQHQQISGTNWVDHTIELKAEFQSRYTAAFGAMKQGNRMKPMVKIQDRTDPACNLCNLPVRKRCRREHIWAFHMKVKRFACLYCDYGSAQKHCMRKHVTTHGNTGGKPCWKDNDKCRSMLVEYEKLHHAAFGIW